MRNDSSNYKKVVFFVVFILLNVVFVYSKPASCYAYSEEEINDELTKNIDSILDDIDTSELDYFIECDEMFEYFSFKDFAQDILSGKFVTDYNSLFNYIKSNILWQIENKMRFFVILFVLIVIYEVFKSFCLNRFIDVKNNVKLVFCFLFCLLVLSLFNSYYFYIEKYVDNIFNFCAILFPILISLVTLSGSVSTASVYGSFSVFLLNTGSYIIKYVLLPLAVSLFLFSMFSSIMKNRSFDKVYDLLKTIFKYIIILFFAVFGLISLVNVVASGAKDGVNLRLTKYAIKNYVPILGGYISDGFDFLHSCSVLVKNSFGVCSVFILFSQLVNPVLSSIVLVLGFKILSVVSCFVGDGTFSGMFVNVSKSLSNFLTIVVGAFVIMFVFIFLLIASVVVV